MSDPSLRHAPTTPTAYERQPTSTTSRLYATVGRALLIAGGISTGASAFLPWLHLSTTFGDGPYEVDVDPWTIVRLDVGSTLLALALALLLVALGVFSGSAVLAFSHSKRAQVALTIPLLVLVFLYANALLLTGAVASTGLSLSWPYYHTAVRFGAGAVIFGCISVALGSLTTLKAR